MMKQKIPLFSLCLLLLCGCADGSDTDIGSGVPVPLRLQSVGVAGEGDVASRAATATLAQDKKIGFFVQEDEFNQLKRNVEGGYVGGAWQPLSTSAGVWLNNHDATIAIYAPYDAMQDNSSSLTLKAGLRGTDEKNNDIMCSEVFTASNANAVITSVTLKQVYTRLVFSFVKDDTYPEPHPLKIKAVELKGNDLYASTTYDLFTATYVKPVHSSVISLDIPDPYPVVRKATEPEPPGIIDLLLIPVTQEFTGDATLTITLTTDKKISVRIPQTTFDAARPFAPGKQYVLKVRILPTTMVIDSVELEDWKEGFIVDKGDEFQFDV